MTRGPRGSSPMPPNGQTPALVRTLDLYRRAPGNTPPVLWRCAVQVVPVDAFERYGRWIKSGHYLIDYKGHAIVVYCGNMSDDNISVQFVDEELTPYSFPRDIIESMLLGKVLASEEQRASEFEGKRLSDFFNSDGMPSSPPTSSDDPAVLRRRKPTT
jgi:hypothetical protein